MAIKGNTCEACWFFPPTTPLRIFLPTLARTPRSLRRCSAYFAIVAGVRQTAWQGCGRNRRAKASPAVELRARIVDRQVGRAAHSRKVVDGRARRLLEVVQREKARGDAEERIKKAREDAKARIEKARADANDSIENARSDADDRSSFRIPYLNRECADQCRCPVRWGRVRHRLGLYSTSRSRLLCQSIALVRRIHPILRRLSCCCS